MKNVAILIGLFLCFTANAQSRVKGNGVMSTKTIMVADYHKINVSGFYDVELYAGKPGTITVLGESNLLDFVKVEVDNKGLVIGTKTGNKISPSRGKTITIKVPFENLDSIGLTGSGDIKNKDQIKTTNLELTLTGSGDVKLNINATAVNATLTGSGDIDLKGKSNDIICKVTGSGDIDASELECLNANATVSGSGDCKVYCTENLTARVSGSGDIEYKGNPKKKDTKSSGSGSIKKS